MCLDGFEFMIRYMTNLVRYLQPIRIFVALQLRNLRHLRQRHYLRHLFYLLTLLVQIFLVGPWARSQPAPAEKKAEAATSITSRNLKGHQVIYNEGWFLVTSTRDAINAAKANSETAAQAWQSATKQGNERFETYGPTTKKRLESVGPERERLSRDYKISGDKLADDLQKNADESSVAAAKKLEEAFSHIIIGYVTLKETTARDFQDFKELNLGVADRMKADFKEVHELIGNTEELAVETTTQYWDKSFSRARQEFKKEYEESGQESNSVQGLYHIFIGYFKGLYHGMLKPSGHSAVEGLKTAGGYAVFGLGAGVAFSGRIVLTLGTNLFYLGRTGYHLISPTLEGGLLASLALASSVAAGASYVGSKSLRVINSVAVESGAAVGATGDFVVSTATDSLSRSALLTYDLANGAGEVMVNHFKSGVVLGYNALTAIPAHLLLGSLNAAVFLVYDGPRLLLVQSSGELNGNFLSTSLKPGMILDIQKLEEQKLPFKTISDDPLIIKKVIKKSEIDFRNNKN